MMLLPEYTIELCHDYHEWYGLIYRNGLYLSMLTGGTVVQLCMQADALCGRVVAVEFGPYAQYFEQVASKRRAA